MMGKSSMNIWDSMHRGLEKASQEAARLARTQRLRSTIDNLSRQMQTQNIAVLNKVLELFAAGQLTQSELLPLCQALVTSQQQLLQAQNELRQLQQGAPSTQTGPGALPPTTSAYPTPGSSDDYTTSTPPPPPPPGLESGTISAINTVPMNVPPPPPGTDIGYCSVCHTPFASGNVYCPNCGTPTSQASQYPPTQRGSLTEQETIRSAPSPDEHATVRPDHPTPDQPTLRANESSPTQYQDGGH
jgi:hypothetical protein